MKGLKIISLLILSGFLFTAFATETTVTLQNGLDGYEGCTDSYCRSESASSNYGDAADVRTKYEVCSS